MSPGPMWSIVPADASDADALATLHVESWRRTYEGQLPAEFLEEPIVEDRRRLWQARMCERRQDRQLVLKAMRERDMVGFACVLADEEPEWGPCLDNLHVRPDLKRLGIGSALFGASLRWALERERLMHLWVFEENHSARRFYDRHGGSIEERQVIEVVADIRVPSVRYVWRVR